MKQVICINIDSDLVECLKKEAKEACRTLSKEIEYRIRQFNKKKEQDIDNKSILDAIREIKEGKGYKFDSRKEAEKALKDE